MAPGTARTPADRVGWALPSWTLPPLVGVLVLLLLGGGVSALLADDVSILDNSVASNAIVEGDIDLQIAGMDDNGCAVATYEDGPLRGTVGLVDVNDYLIGGESYLDGGVLCIRNTGTSPALASVRTEVSIDQETGPCRPSEIAAGDTTCGDGDDGELAEEILVRYEWSCPRDAASGQGPSGALVDPTSLELGVIGAGEICTLAFRPEVQPSDPQLWQTDEVYYDLHVDGIVAEDP